MSRIDENMRLLPRKCGGWLAVSHRWADIRIGVMAESEDEAREKYRAAIAAWRKLLAGGEEAALNPA